MEKREGELKSALTKEVKLQLPGFLTLLFATAGAPDRMIVGNNRVSLWEFKHGTPNFESPGLQALTCSRIAAQGVYCRYIVWQETRREQRTLIVHPKVILERNSYAVWPELQCEGFDMIWLVHQIRKVHT
jgi:hypothetical protein